MSFHCNIIKKSIFSRTKWKRSTSLGYDMITDRFNFTAALHALRPPSSLFLGGLGSSLHPRLGPLNPFTAQSLLYPSPYLFLTGRGPTTSGPSFGSPSPFSPSALASLSATSSSSPPSAQSIIFPSASRYAKKASFNNHLVSVHQWRNTFSVRLVNDVMTTLAHKNEMWEAEMCHKLSKYIGLNLVDPWHRFMKFVRFEVLLHLSFITVHTQPRGMKNIIVSICGKGRSDTKPLMGFCNHNALSH